MIPQGGALHRFILETFAKTGHSPTLEDIQQAFNLSSVEAAEALITDLERKGAIHRNPGDRQVTHAYPFSNEPTPHRVQLAGGPQVYAMCAVDALGMPFMLKQDAEIHSICAQCGQEIRIQIQSAQITSQAPEDIVAWYPQVSAGCCPATEQCPHLNFFCSPEHLRQWSREHPEQSGEVLTLEQALEAGRNTFGRLLAR